MALLKCTDLTLGYAARTVVKDLSFEVNEGDYLCIVGDNGSGKTTLMKALLGLNPLISGSIVVGQGINRNEIGYLPQQTDLQRDFPASVREVVMSGFAGKSRGFGYTKQMKTECAENLEKMGISHLARRSYRELSGGQQQRVLLARALCATEKLILLDEPVAGLDPHVTAEMYAVIERINREDGVTVIMISHDIAAAMKYATHILDIGRTRFFGRKEDYVECECCRSEHKIMGVGKDE